MKKLLLLTIAALFLSGCTAYKYNLADYDYQSQSRISTDNFKDFWVYGKWIEPNVHCNIGLKEFSDNFKGWAIVYVEITNLKAQPFEFQAAQINFSQANTKVLPISKAQLQKFINGENTKIEKQLNYPIKDEVTSYKEALQEFLKDELIRKSADIKSYNWYKKINYNIEYNYLEGQKTILPNQKNYYITFIKLNDKLPLDIEFNGVIWQFKKGFDSIWNY